MAVPGCECERCTGKRWVETPKPQTLSQLVTLQQDRIATLERRLAALEVEIRQEQPITIEHDDGRAADIECRLAALEARVGTGAEP